MGLEQIILIYIYIYIHIYNICVFMYLFIDLNILFYSVTFYLFCTIYNVYTWEEYGRVSGHTVEPRHFPR